MHMKRRRRRSTHESMFAAAAADINISVSGFAVEESTSK